MNRLALIFTLIVFFISCSVLSFGDGELTTDLKIESNEISNIQDIEATFTVRNAASNSKTYNFNSGCQAAFKILREGVEVFDSAKNVFCTQALTSFVLKKNESKSFSLPKYFDVALEQGNYSIKAYLIGYEDEVNASKKFVVN